MLTRKLTLVAAPAGYGKTALLSAWLHTRSIHAGWIALDEGDNDPVRFLTYVVAALQQTNNAIGQAALGMLSVLEPPSIASLITIIINDLAEIPEAITLVLDDYHLISNPAIHNALVFLMEHQPETLHLVILTREVPPLPLPRLRARGELVDIRAGDLSFSIEEAADFLSAALSMAPSEDIVSALTARTEGWIAGLQLAALSLRDRDDVASFVEEFTGSHRYVMDYLFDEVLRQQPQEIKTFLLQTAILDRLSAPLCDALTGRHDSKDLLAELERTNLFLIPLDDRREWYRYHQLFADLLRTELEPEEDMQAQRTAAQWYQEKGLLREAIKHWLAAGETAGAAVLIDLMSKELLQTGELTTLLGWLDALPDDLVCKEARLGPLKALCLFVTGRYEEGAAIVRRIQDCLQPGADPASLGRLRVMQAYMTRLNPKQALPYTREAVDLLGDGDPPFSTMALIFMGNHQTAANPTEAVNTFHRVVQIARNQRDVFIDVIALSDLLAILDMQGRRQEAANLANECIAYYADAQGEPLAATGVILAHAGALAYAANDLRAADQYVRQGVALCRQLAVPVGTALGLRWLAMIQYAWGHHGQAFDSVREARRLALEARNETLIYQCISTEADFLLRQGRISEARRKSNRLPNLEWPPENPYHVHAHLIAIRLMLAQGELQEAQRLLAGLREWAGRLGFVGYLIPILILQARVALSHDDTDAALTALCQAVDLAAPEEYRRPFLDADNAILTMLPDVHHASPSFVESLLTPSERAEAPQLLSDPLTEREIEVLHLIADGLANQEIADHLVIGISTVKTHINRIYSKLDVSHRAQAVARARELNLLP